MAVEAAVKVENAADRLAADMAEVVKAADKAAHGLVLAEALDRVSGATSAGVRVAAVTGPKGEVKDNAKTEFRPQPIASNRGLN